MTSTNLLLGALTAQQPASHDTLTTAIIVFLCLVLLVALIGFGLILVKGSRFVGDQFKLFTKQLEKSNTAFDDFRDEQKETNDTMKQFMKDSKRDSEQLRDMALRHQAKLEKHEDRLNKHDKIILKHHPDAKLD